jgi:hypothetical protein
VRNVAHAMTRNYDGSESDITIHVQFSKKQFTVITQAINSRQTAGCSRLSLIDDVSAIHQLRLPNALNDVSIKKNY